jgi:septal ring factor EnvC (AmiA/AmiB activator)
MTSKLTARFLRRADAGAEPAVTPAPVAADKPETTPAVAAAPDEAKPDGALKSEATMPEDQSTAAAKPTVPPARMVEVEKPKAGRPDLAQAKAWFSNAQAYRMPAAAAAALVFALGAGYGLGTAGQSREVASAKTVQMLEKTARDLRDANGQVGQLAAELKSMKAVVDGIRGEREKSRSDILAKQAQLSDRLERAGQENATRVGRLAEQLDRIEKAQREAHRQAAAERAGKGEKTADKGEKAEKPEKVAAAPVPPAKPNLDVAHTGSLGDAKAVEKLDPRKTPLDGYIVRDYDEGFALIETRSGRYIDVAVGYTLPGVGRVEAIERRGRQWVVITPKGYIGER